MKMIDPFSKEGKEQMAHQAFAQVEDALQRCSKAFTETKGSSFDHRIRFLTIKCFAMQMLKETEKEVPSLMLLVEPHLEQLIMQAVEASVVSVRIQIDKTKEDKNGMPGL
jgi:undecaprenyl pyrophosphate synthase